MRGRGNLMPFFTALFIILGVRMLLDESVFGECPFVGQSIPLTVRLDGARGTNKTSSRSDCERLRCWIILWYFQIVAHQLLLLLPYRPRYECRCGLANPSTESPETHESQLTVSVE